MNSYVMYLTNSEYGKIARGVSQRSVLGPLLFPLYIDDIGNSLPNTPIKLFADYTNLFILITTQLRIYKLMPWIK